MLRWRSYSINPSVGGPSERTCGGVPWLDFSGFTIYYKLGDMLNTGPSQIFVLLNSVTVPLAARAEDSAPYLHTS